MRRYNEELWKLTLGALVAVVIFSLLGCRSSSIGMKPSVSRFETDSSMAETDRETLRWDSIVKRDSVYVRDSVAIRQVGDTVYTDRWHWEYIYDFFHLERLGLDKDKKSDFRFIARSDTVRVPYPVEKELSKWEQFQLKYAIWSMGALCMVLFYLCYKLYKWIKNGGFNHNNIKK